MITTDELSMGCLLDTPEGVRATKAAQLNIGAIDFDNGSRYDIALCHPVPLTEEWINKLGLTVWARTNDDSSMILVNEYASMTITKDVHFVHQLQRKYFDTTGTILLPSSP